MLQSNSLSSLDEITLYRSKHLESHLIVDTNVLLLFLVGIYNQNYLKDCPMIRDMGKDYGAEHFKLVEEIIKRFLYKVVITPHILSEVNMLSHTRIKPKELHLHNYLSSLIRELEKWKEHTIGMKMLLEDGAIMEFGFTDISLVKIAEENKENKWTILTDDLPLYANFISKIPIIYFGSVVTNEITLKLNC